MSQENVEVVRSLAEAFQQRDHERVFQFYDPDIEWDASRQAALMSDVASVCHGHEGVRSFWRTWLFKAAKLSE
jgi:ketosteroid isomerase-like protein